MHGLIYTDGRESWKDVPGEVAKHGVSENHRIEFYTGREFVRDGQVEIGMFEGDHDDFSLTTSCYGTLGTPV